MGPFWHEFSKLVGVADRYRPYVGCNLVAQNSDGGAAWPCGAPPDLPSAPGGAASTPRTCRVYDGRPMAPLERPIPEGFVPMAVAVHRLRKSDRTIRRMIERGELEGEPIARPQGTVWYVRVPPEDAAVGGSAASDQGHEPNGIDLAVAALDAALRRAEERADALNERNERQADIVVAQAQRIGELSAQLDAAKAEAARPWWRRLLRE